MVSPLRVNVLFCDAIDYDAYSTGAAVPLAYAYLCVTHNGVTRRTASRPVRAGRALWSQDLTFDRTDRTDLLQFPLTIGVRLILEDALSRTSAVVGDIASLDISVVAVTRRKHLRRVSFSSDEYAPSLQIGVSILHDDHSEPFPITESESAWLCGWTRVTVGTQTLVSGRSGVDSPRLAPSLALSSDPLISSPTREPQSESAHSPVLSRGLANDIELARKLSKSWPRDEVEGVLRYVEVLRHDKAMLEQQLARTNFELAKHAIRADRLNDDEDDFSLV